MEAYRAYWEQNQGTATAVSPEEPPAQIPPEPEQAPPATSWETPPEESPVFEPPLAPLPEEPAFEAALAEPTPPTEPLVEPPVASLPPPPEEGKAEETPAPTPSTTWFEHHTDTPQAAEAAVPPAPLPQTVSTEEPALFQEELPTPQQAPSALSQTLPALGLSLLVATATGVFLAMGWISALAGGLLGTAALLFLRRSAPPALCLAPVLWASAATLFGTLAAGRGPWLTLPFPLPLSGTPATAAHLLLGLLVLPVVLCWLVAKNLRNTEKIDVLPMPGKLGILTGILGLVLAMAVFALGLKPVFAPKADAEVLTAACRGQVALLSLLPSKGLPLPPVRANLQATLIPPFMPPAAPGEVTSASILVSAPTVSPDQLQCEYLCTSPKICRLSQLSLPSPMADMALFAISAPSAPAMPVPVPTPVSPSSTLSASGQTPAMMQFPALTDAALPIVAECTAVMEAFGHETAAKGKKCDEITTNTRWSGWLQGYGRANCPSLTLSQPQDGPCVLEAKGRSNAGKVCVIRAQAGEKPSVTCQ